MPAFTDQLGRTITLDRPPSRIISLVPSQTELLYDLGANVVGITKFCVHPSAWFREKPRIGGTKNIHPDIIARLHPDLIISPRAIVRLVDGELFSWYGSRLLQAPAYFRQLMADCHADLHKKDEL